MEIVGRRTGKQRNSQETSELSVVSTEKRREEEEEKQGSEAEAGANAVGGGKRAVGLAECKEDEDAVMLGGSGETLVSVY